MRSACESDKIQSAAFEINRNNRVEVRTMKNSVLIWLDSNIDDDNEDCQQSISRLGQVVNKINTFTDAERCIRFLKNMDGEKACVITSGSLGEKIVPRIHSLSQVDSIFIFCGNQQYHEQWAKNWPKIRGVFTKIKRICEALKQAPLHHCVNEIPISIVDAGDGFTKKDFDQLDASFMYTQIIKEILLNLTFDGHHIQEFIQHCRDEFSNKKDDLNCTNEFEQKYCNCDSILWYTRECFLYRMLNRALRELDVDVIMKLGFFISDLHSQIARLHKEQFSALKCKQRLTVYRGQAMNKESFEQMKIEPGRLLAFNSFLSTSRQREIARRFIKVCEEDNNLVGVLFIMTIDPAQFTTPFARISNFGYYKNDEQELLFSMHTVFRIGEVKRMPDNYQLIEVKLTLTNDDDTDLRQVTDVIRKETCSEVQGWARMAATLLKMGEPKRAQKVYEILLAQATQENVKAHIYNQLGVIKDDLGEYSEAIQYYKRCLHINKKVLPSNHPNLAASYTNIGVAYRNMNDYSNALVHYKEALSIQKQSLPHDDPNLIKTYNNMGNVLISMNDPNKALAYYETVLSVRQQSLPPKHPDLANCYNNIGNAYAKLNDYQQALEHYEKALSIRQHSLPSKHPDIATSYVNIGNAYGSMGDCQKALVSYEKALIIQEKSSSPNPSRLAMLHYNMGVLYEKMDDYSKAHSSYQLAVNIGEKLSPSDLPDLQKYRNKLAQIKKK